MIFNSFIFWAFFAFVVVVYWRLPHRQQNWFLLVASYTFYGYWDWRYLFLLWTSTLVDYLVGRGLDHYKDPRRRKQLITVSVCANLGFLAFFKYCGFFVTQFADLLRSFGLEPSIPVLAIVLPVGISFYTFQTMSYTIEVYRGKTPAARKLEDFALFVAYFPPLVAGPIERYQHLMPQLKAPRVWRREYFGEGLYHVLFGLFKKVIVADNLAPIVSHVFSTPTAQLSSFEVMVGALAFALQIYGDFSGYSSIAQGVSKWMGVDLSYNFRMPYFARTPSEFWQRWHISLSSWLRDYLYIPLGGNRKGVTRTYINLALTMLLGGLWHGAAWTFVFWGAWHGLLLVAYRAAGAEHVQPAGHRLLAVGQALLMFIFVCTGWIFFRASSLEQALGMIGALFGSYAPTEFGVYALSMLLFLVSPLMVYEWFVYRADDMLMLLRRPAWQRYCVYLYLVLMIVVMPPLAQQVFIYFQF
jgi:D-alanyl-lipoteichoic acid acyltransferase DltB (MBOAT superfamily)